jgi:hypothetical protein
MPPTRRRFRLPVLALVLALSACVGEEHRLERELSEVYGDAVVGFTTLDSTTMVVTVFAPPFADRPDADRRVTARKIGGFVRDHYARYKALVKVVVELVLKKDKTLKHVAASYTFTRAELGPPPAATAPPAASGVPPGG